MDGPSAIMPQDRPRISAARNNQRLLSSPVSRAWACVSRPVAPSSPGRRGSLHASHPALGSSVLTQHILLTAKAQKPAHANTLSRRSRHTCRRAVDQSQSRGWTRSRRVGNCFSSFERKELRNHSGKGVGAGRGEELGLLMKSQPSPSLFSSVSQDQSPTHTY